LGGLRERGISVLEFLPPVTTRAPIVWQSKEPKPQKTRKGPLFTERKKKRIFFFFFSYTIISFLVFCFMPNLQISPSDLVAGQGPPDTFLSPLYFFFPPPTNYYWYNPEHPPDAIPAVSFWFNHPPSFFLNSIILPFRLPKVLRLP